MKPKTLQITRTAALLALLIVLQAVTKPAGQLVTGSCVNAVLAVTALACGVWPGVAVALISPFAAFLLGIGPQLIAVVPAIAAGNLVDVLLLCLIAREGAPLARQLLAWLAASAAKFLTLYLIVVQLLCRVLPLKDAQLSLFSTMFSWPQLVTALIGGALALAIVPLIRRARRSDG